MSNVTSLISTNHSTHYMDLLWKAISKSRTRPTTELRSIFQRPHETGSFETTISSSPPFHKLRSTQLKCDFLIGYLDRELIRWIDCYLQGRTGTKIRARARKGKGHEDQTSYHLIAKFKKKIVVILGGPTGRSSDSPTGQSAPGYLAREKLGVAPPNSISLTVLPHTFNIQKLLE